MAFVNEIILEADKEKYGFEANTKFYVAQPSQWTVDRSREMFLVHRLSYGPEGSQNLRYWAFCWKAKVFDVMVENVSIETDSDDDLYAVKRVISINGNAPNESTCQEMLIDLKDALAVYGVAGLLIPFKSFHLELVTT